MSLPSKVSSGHPGERQGQNQNPPDRLFLPKGRVHAQGFCLAGVLVVPTSAVLELSGQRLGLSQVDTRSSLDLAGF